METTNGMIVGIDGTEPAGTALSWAMAHTDVFGPVIPVYVWTDVTMASAATPFGYAALPPTSEMAAAAETAAHEFVAGIDGLDDEVAVLRGDPGAALCERAESAAAAAIVVGSRGRGPLRAGLLGSVGRYCADHTTVPLIIVPRGSVGAAAHPTRTVVVGIDGSEAATASLLAAARTFPDATITAATAWQTPVDGPVLFNAERFDLVQLRAHARSVVDAAADKVCEELGWEPERIERHIAEGDPRWVLLDLQADTDLLVVGQRGRTGLAHLVLGSTTTSLLHRPRCPIMVIPTHDHA